MLNTAANTAMPINLEQSILLVLVMGVQLTSGCSGPDPFGDWNDRELADRVAALSRSQPQHSAIVSRDAPQTPTDTPPPEGAGVNWFVTAALESNAEIRAARQRVERMREKIPQATALPDPMATFTFGELSETAAGLVDYDIGVQQSLPFPGTLDARGEVARQEVVEALHELKAVTDRVRADVHRAYWAYFDATREAAVLEQSRVLLTQIGSSVDSRVRVNRASQADLLRVSRRIAKLDNQLSALEQRRTTASAMLSRLMSRNGGQPPRPILTETDWYALELDRAELIGQGIHNNPRVKAAQARAGTFRQKLALTRIDRLPDFVVGVKYTEVADSGLSPIANGDDQFAGIIGVTIPIWSRKYDAAEREAMRGMGEALAGVRAAQDRVSFEIDESLARIEANEQTLRRLRERMMPDARQTIDVALTGYSTGDVTLLQLLEDWQDLLDDQVQEASVIADLYRSVATLEQALGDRLTSSTPRNDDPAAKAPDATEPEGAR